MAGTRVLYINSIALAGYAIFLSPIFEKQYLSLLLLLLPLLDRGWKLPISNIYRNNIKLLLPCFLLVLALMVDEDKQPDLLLITILLVALPEEWFFRAYYYDKLTVFFKSNLLANILTSAFFALLHMPVQGMQGLLVFIPSLIFGWVYQKYKNLSLVIIIHALCNYIYLRFVNNFNDLFN